MFNDHKEGGMAKALKDGHIGRGDHLDYLCSEERGDTKADVLSAVSKVFIEKFGDAIRKMSARRASNGMWVVSVWIQ